VQHPGSRVSQLFIGTIQWQRVRNRHLFFFTKAESSQG
jgi:hypothetical protein